jgi:AraC-like DNA-binding protein
MPYREFGPRGDLSDLVACTWERTVPADEPASPTRVLPDGCVDLVWRQGGLFVAGPDVGPFLSPVRAGETIVGLRFRPGAAGRGLGLPASELCDTRVALEDVWGRRGAELAARIGEAGSPRAQRDALEDAVARRLPDLEAPDALVLAAARRLGAAGSRVGGLSEALGTSERQLLRRFNAAVGYGPKTLDRVLRFQRFLSSAPAVARGELGLARAAADLGYADQAHLSRECMRLSGLTPTRLVRAA